MLYDRGVVTAFFPRFLNLEAQDPAQKLDLEKNTTAACTRDEKSHGLGTQTRITQKKKKMDLFPTISG